MNKNSIYKTALLAALGAAVAMPAAAVADPAAGVWSPDLAAPVPHIPGTFAGAPTNDDPSTGQFSVAFDASGFGRIGRPEEPPATIDISPGIEGPSYGRTQSGTGDSAATESAFAGLRAQLRALARPQHAVAVKTAQR